MHLIRTISPVRFILIATALLALAVLAFSAADDNRASAAKKGSKTPKGSKNFEIGFVDGQFSDNLLTSTDPKVRSEWFKKLKKTNAEFARLNIYWSETAGASEPASPTNPDDPSYDWSIIDDAVLSAKKQKIDVMLTVLSAPEWAEGPGPPGRRQGGSLEAQRGEAR